MAEVRSGSFKTTGYSDANSPDHYVFSWTLASQSIVDNTTTINWEVVAAGGATSGYYNTVKEKYVTVYGATKTNSDWQTTYNGTKPFSGTTVIKHDSNGKGSFSASCGGAFEFSGSYNSTGSGTWDLPTIHRATTPVLASTTITMGSSINITLTPANSTFKHKLRYDFGSVKGSASGFSVGAEYTAQGNVTVTFTPPTSLGSQIPNNLSGTGQVVCYTYTSSGTHIGTTYVKITLNIPSYTPSITGITLTGKNLLSSAYVQSKSSVTVNATAQTSYGANIKSITSVIDGKSYSGLPFTTNVLSSGSKTVKITLVDTRDKSVTVESATIQVYAYSVPNITHFALARQSDGTTVVATIQGSIAAINNKNAKTIKVTLNGVTNTVTSSSYTINATTTFTNVSTDQTFTAKAVFTDSYTSVERAATLPTVAVTMDFYKDGNGIAMGKVAEEGDLLDVSWKAKFRKILSVISDTFDALTITRLAAGSAATINFRNGNGSLGYIGMSGTANLGLTRWSADGQSGYSFLDTGNTKDFVIEQGTSGSWTYRKWNNGVAECWGTLAGTISPYTTINGFSAYEGGVNFPTGLFTATPNVQFQPYIGNGFAIPARGVISTNTQCKWVALSNVSAANTAVKIDVFAIGKWK